MKRLHWFIIKSYLGPFILTFFISIFLLLMQFLWKYIDELVGKGLDFLVIAELLLYASTTIVPMALPLAILLSSLMTFGNLGEHYELTALKSAGISLMKIMRPLIILTIIIAIGAFFFSNNVMPYTNLKMGTLLFDVRHQRPEISIKEGIFDNTLEGFSIRITRKDFKTNMLHKIMIYDHRKSQGNISVTMADSGLMEIINKDQFLMLTLFNGSTYEEEREQGKRNISKPASRSKFKEQRIIIELRGYGFSRSDENLFKGNYQMLNLKQLEVTIDSLRTDRDTRYKNFSRNLLANYYFKKLNNQLFLNDSLPPQLEKKVVSPDSVFMAMSPDERDKVIEFSKEYARSAQSYITNSRSEFFSYNKTVAKHEIEWHRKFTLSFACIILFFVGAPLGAIIRKGGLGMPVVVSVFFFVLYYVLTITGEKYVKGSILQAWVGMWYPPVIFLMIGGYLTYKATHDSSLFNIDAYVNAIEKFIRPVLHIMNKITGKNEETAR